MYLLITNHHLMNTKRFIFSLVAVALFVACVVITPIYTQAQSAGLVIEPSGPDLEFNAGSIQQFRAYYNGEDVTSEAKWSGPTKYFSTDKMGTLLAPGLFRLLQPHPDVRVGAKYNGKSASASFKIVGGWLTEDGFLRPDGALLKPGETVKFEFMYNPEKFCTPEEDERDECFDPGRQLKYGILPPHVKSPKKNVASKALWESSNPSVLELVSPGVFRAVSDGKATVNATYNDYSPIYKVEVVVQTPTTGQYDVSLIQKDPIFTNGKVFVAHHINQHDFFGSILSMIGSDNKRYFVVGGYCSMVNVNWGGGGMYLFTDTGEYVGKRDICIDALNGDSPAVCKHDTGCHAIYKTFDIGNGMLVRDMGIYLNEANARPWIAYKVSSFGIEMIYRPFTTRQGRIQLPPLEVGDPIAARQIAYANDVLIDLESISEVGGKYGTTNKFYSFFPNARVIATANTNKPPHKSQNYGVYGPKYVPIAGVGEYFLAYPEKFKDIYVYRMPSQNELISGKDPELVQTLEIGEIKAYAVDSQDSTRIAIVTRDETDFDVGNVRIYKAGAKGLTLERNIGSIPIDSTVHISTSQRLALSGEYFAYGFCTTDSRGWREDCKIEVLKNGSKLSVEPLPLNKFGRKQRVQGIEISPSGNMMVGTRGMGTDGWTSNGINYDQYLYMYKINGATPQLPVQPPQPPPVPSGTGPVGGGNSIDVVFGCKTPSLGASLEETLEFNQCVLRNLSKYKW
jgi:hypothetical protein